MRTSLGLCFCASVFALACTADILGGDGGQAPDGPSLGSGGGGVGVGGAGSTPVGTAALAGPSLRLLTGSQYRATLRSLFSFADDVPVELEDDVALNGLHAIGSSNIALSPKATERYLEAADAVATRAFANNEAAAASAGCDVSQQACVDGFLTTFGRRAFRRSLTLDERARFTGIYQAGLQKLGAPAEGLKYATMAILSSPYFVYRVELGRPVAGKPGVRALTGSELASKLAYFLWDGPPDGELLDLGESGGLEAPGALAAQTARLLAASEASRGLDALFDDYLGLAQLEAIEKLPGKFPTFGPELAQAMRQETRLNLRKAALTNADFRSVFNSRKTHVNEALAKLYGVGSVTGPELVEVELPASSERRGLLGNASLLSLHAHSSISSPTLRGKFIRQILMCQSIPAPPPDVDTTLPETGESATARERLALHSTNPSCAGCHKLMDPLGLPLENFDAIGQYRSDDNGQVIDASGELDGVAFNGPVGLADALAESPTVPACLSRLVFRSAWGRLETPADEGFIADLTRAFVDQQHQWQRLLSAATTSSRFASTGELDP